MLLLRGALHTLKGQYETLTHFFPRHMLDLSYFFLKRFTSLSFGKGLWDGSSTAGRMLFTFVAGAWQQTAQMTETTPPPVAVDQVKYCIQSLAQGSGSRGEGEDSR